MSHHTSVKPIFLSLRAGSPGDSSKNAIKVARANERNTLEQHRTTLLGYRCLMLADGV